MTPAGNGAIIRQVGTWGLVGTWWNCVRESCSFQTLPLLPLNKTRAQIIRSLIQRKQKWQEIQMGWLLILLMMFAFFIVWKRLGLQRAAAKCPKAEVLDIRHPRCPAKGPRLFRSSRPPPRLICSVCWWVMALKTAYPTANRSWENMRNVVTQTNLQPVNLLVLLPLTFYPKTNCQQEAFACIQRCDGTHASCCFIITVCLAVARFFLATWPTQE